MNEWSSPYWLASMQARYPQPVPSQSLPNNNSMMMTMDYYHLPHNHHHYHHPHYTNNNSDNDNNSPITVSTTTTCRHQVSNRTKRKPQKFQQQKNQQHHSRRSSVPHSMQSSSVHDHSLLPPPPQHLPLKKKKPISSPPHSRPPPQNHQRHQHMNPQKQKIKRKPVPPVSQLAHAIEDIHLTTNNNNNNANYQHRQRKIDINSEDEEENGQKDGIEEPITRPSHPLKSLQNQQIMLRSPLSVSSASSSLFELSSPSSASSTSSTITNYYGLHHQPKAEQYKRQSLPLPETSSIFTSSTSNGSSNISKAQQQPSARHQYRPHKLNRIHSARPHESDDDDANKHHESTLNIDIIESDVMTDDLQYNRDETESVLQPTFWNPRPEPDVGAPIRRNLSRKLKGLLQPQKLRMEGVTKDQHQQYRIWSVERPKSPPPLLGQSSTATELNHRPLNPFQILSNTLPVANELTLDHFHENEFAHIDTYTSNVKQRGPMLTPTLLATKFLARPYRQDLHKVRAIFVWIIQNIVIENSINTSSAANSGANSSRPSLDIQHSNEISSNTHTTAITSTAIDNTSELVLSKRTCSSALGMANLFCEMANAIDLEAQVICGYLRGHKDTMPADGVPVENHAWCSVKIGGEYRFIDCWLASPYHYANMSIMESHWFLCQPLDMIYTHFPTNPIDQYLEPHISLNTFFALPYVCLPFFHHHIQVIDYDSSNLIGDAICHITLQVDPDIACYAEVETRSQLDATRTRLVKTRGLAQCLDNEDQRGRICKIKAHLPSDQWMGWLKIYAGPRIVPTTTGQQQEKINAKHYPFALSFRLSRQQQVPRQQLQPFDFVQLHLCQYEFYVQEPQCHQLYPLQRYHFSVKSNQTHHKLAIRSPNGRLYKLMYYPHDHTYDGTITVGEAGQWTLVCLLHHAGGLYVVASWDCKA